MKPASLPAEPVLSATSLNYETFRKIHLVAVFRFLDFSVRKKKEIFSSSLSFSYS